MKRMNITLIAISTIIILFAAAYFILKTYTPNTNTNNPCLLNPDSPTVSRVIDGDTFELCSGEKVRLLCVNTPEKGQPGYEEASDFLSGLILDKKVTLTSSNYNGNDTDKYGRLLRWVYINNEETGEIIFVNKYILDEGYGDLMIIPPETCNEVSD